MGTHEIESSLGTVLFGKTRRAILALTYGHPGESYYLRQVARSVGLGMGTVQRELRLLTASGILERTGQGRSVFFTANPACPIFEELRSVVSKTFGTTDSLRAALAPLADRIGVAFVHGSVAKGEQKAGSDVDVLIIGDLTFGEAVTALASAQERMGREINPSVFCPADFRDRVKSKNHFITSVLASEKLFLIGDVLELGRLAKGRMAR